MKLKLLQLCRWTISIAAILSPALFFHSPEIGRSVGEFSRLTHDDEDINRKDPPTSLFGAFDFNQTNSHNQS